MSATVNTMTNTPLTPDDIMTWLRAHPDFLDKYPDACEFLTPPQEKKEGGIADFGSYLVKRLKADREEVLTTSATIMETARANMNNVTRIHRAVLRLLDAPSFSEFIDTLTNDIATQLDTDICTLVVEAGDGVIPHVHINGIRMVPGGTISKWMGANSVVLQSNISGSEAIYGGGATLVSSQALLRLNISDSGTPALLAFGSRDPAFFADGQGTELIAFLAGVVERTFRAWLR